jgi:hypothetical protein
MIRPSARLPLFLSLLVHGLFLLLFGLLSVSPQPAVRPILEAVRLETRSAGAMTLVARSNPPRPPRSAPANASETGSGKLNAHVVDPPLYAAAAGPDNPSPEGPPAPNGNPQQGSGQQGESTGEESDSTGGGGREAKTGTRFFPAGDSIHSVAYVVDCSLSMGEHHALDRAKAELLASLESLPATARFQVILYNREAAPLLIQGQRGLLPMRADVLKEVAARIAAQEATRGTDHWKALSRGLALQPEVLYLVTDADDLEPITVRNVTRLNRGRTIIHAIELNNHPTARPDSPLRQLAAANGGTYRHINPTTGNDW